MKHRFFTFLFCTFIATAFNSLFSQTTSRVKIAPDLDTTFVCGPQGIDLQVLGGFNHSWRPANILNRTDGSSVTARPTQNTWVVVEGFVNGRLQKDSIYLAIVTPTLQLTTTNSTAVCRGTPVTLRAISNTRGQNIVWDPVEGLNQTTGATVIATPPNTATYRAVINLSNAPGCRVERSVSVEIAPAKIDIAFGDTLKVCKGKNNTTTLIATTNNGLTQGITWSASDGSLNRTNTFQAPISPRVSTKYYVSFNSQQCLIRDSIFVKVDSLPKQDITIDPKKEAYCVGQVVTLKSDIYETTAYPGIKHLWRPRQRSDGTTPSVTTETPDSLWNMVLTLADSVVMLRETSIGGCKDSAAIFIPVIKPKNIIITPEKPEICPSESVQLRATWEGKHDKISWSPMEGISCMDCPNPTVFGLSTSREFTITVEEKGCPSSASRLITVLPTPSINFTNQRTICPGTNVRLLAGTQPNVTYRWTAPLTSSDPNLSVAPTTTTTYRLTATLGRCSVNSDLIITVITPPTIDIQGKNAICEGEAGNLSLNVTPPPANGRVDQLVWQIPGRSISGNTLSFAELGQTTQVRAVLTYGVQNGPTCGTAVDTQTVRVTRMPTFANLAGDVFVFTPDTVLASGAQEGDRITVGVRFRTTPSPLPNLTYQWRVNNEAPQNANNTTIQVGARPTTQTFAVTVTGPNGCAISKEITIQVNPAQVTVPNAFTPNGDGNNDFFRPLTLNRNIQFIEFKIFNRFGQIVFNDPANARRGWDGNINGRPAPPDVYVYRIVFTFPDGRRETLTGDVALLR
jgi:gliding motility-associated-like protein